MRRMKGASDHRSLAQESQTRCVSSLTAAVETTTHAGSLVVIRVETDSRTLETDFGGVEMAFAKLQPKPEGKLQILKLLCSILVAVWEDAALLIGRKTFPLPSHIILSLSILNTLSLPMVIPMQISSLTSEIPRVPSVNIPASSCWVG